MERKHGVILRKILYLRICFCNLSVNHRDSYILYSTNILYINIKASKLHVCLLCIKLNDLSWDV